MKKSVRVLALMLVAVIMATSFSLSTFAVESESDITVKMTERTHNSITIEWNDVPFGISYDVERSANGENGIYEVIGKTNNPEFTDTGLPGDTVYSYRVISWSDKLHHTDYSNVVTVSTCPDIGVDSLTLGAGNSKRIKLDTTVEHNLTSSDKSVATISSAGLITAVKEGTATISVANSDNAVSKCEVTVKTAPKTNKLNKSSITMGIDESYTLKSVTDVSSEIADVSFVSSDVSVANVDYDGKIIAKKAGTTYITAKTYNGLSDKCKVVVKKAPTSLTLNADNLLLGINGVFDLNTSVNSGAGAVIRSFSSDNPEVASVNASGIVTANKVGTAVITSVVYNGVKAECKITVAEAPDKLTLSKSAITIGDGEKYTLKATTDSGSVADLTYSSNNTSIATVSNSGVVTGISNGQATIAVKTYNGLYAYLSVTVKNAPKTIKLNKSSLNTMGAQEQYDLNSSVNSGSASYSRKYTTSNSSIATVDSAGIVTAKKSGTAVITVTTFNGIKSTCKVYVKNEPVSVSMNYTNATLTLGGKIDLNSKVNSGAGGYVRKYTSDDTSVATVNSSGIVTGVSIGSTKINLTLYNGVEATCDITVVDAPSSIVYKYKSLTMGVGEKFTNPVSFTGGTSNSRTASYSSSKSSVATVSSSGIITAKAVGTATITAKTVTGLKTTCTIVVKKAPTSISLSASSATIYLTQTYSLVSSLPSGSASLQRTWSSSNNDVATVNSSGLVTPKRKGTCYISITTYNGKTAKFKITIRVVEYKKAYTSAKVRKDIEALAYAYPGLIKVSSIGKSAKGADIPLVKLGKGSKKALIGAGIHSREYLTIGFTMRCIEEYAAAYYSSTGKYGSYDIKSMLNKYTLYIVPMINPDGLDIVTNSQKTLYDGKTKTTIYKGNANGVNLNRNFPFCWDKITDGSTDPKINNLEKYKGKSAGSEAETKALMTLCANNDFNWLFSMHLYGNNVYWSDKINGVINGAETLVNKLNKNCGFIKSPSTTDPNGYGGGFENWFRSKYKKPGFCVELVPLSCRYNYAISDTSKFDTLTNWSKTKYTFIQGMM